MRKTALAGALVAGLMAPAAASAAPATFAGTCDFNGSATFTPGQFQTLYATPLTANSGQCSGRLVRADGVTLTGTHQAKFSGAQTEPVAACTASAGAGPDVTNRSKATITFVDVYPAPAPGADPPDELIRTTVAAGAHVQASSFRWLLQGATNGSYPAGTFASLDATYGSGTCTGWSMTARLTTGTSPSTSAPTDVLVDAG